MRSLLLIIAIVGLASCQKELSFDDGTVASAGNCKSCSYVPWCNGSTFSYIDTSSSGTATPGTSTINIVKDTVIDGKVFQKFSNPGADGYYNCTAGVSTVIAYSVPATGGSVTKLEQTLLKANEAVGATWTNTVTNGVGQNVNYSYQIIAKGMSKTVLGVVYNDVIQVHLTTSITVPVLGTIIMSEGDYFYANNIGLIDNITYSVDPLFGTQTMVLHRVLQSYMIP